MLGRAQVSRDENKGLELHIILHQKIQNKNKNKKLIIIIIIIIINCSIPKIFFISCILNIF